MRLETKPQLSRKVYTCPGRSPSFIFPLRALEPDLASFARYSMRMVSRIAVVYSVADLAAGRRQPPLLQPTRVLHESVLHGRDPAAAGAFPRQSGCPGRVDPSGL